jgi:PKD repeat protein
MIAVIAIVVSIMVGGIAVGSFLTVNASWQCGQIQQGNFNVVCTSNPTGTPPYSYVWNFGDGSALAYLQNPSHVYSTAGTYTITIQITDGSGSVYKNSMSLCVSDVNGNCPTVTSQGPSFSATISASNMNPTVNSFVNFNANIHGGIAPFMFSWNIVGTPSSLQSPSYGFQNPGSLPV